MNTDSTNGLPVISFAIHYQPKAERDLFWKRLCWHQAAAKGPYRNPTRMDHSIAECVAFNRPVSWIRSN